MRRFTLLVVALLASTASLLAHDMWIDPTAFLPEVGKIIGVRLRVGQDLLGDPLPRDPGLIDQFVIADASGRRDIVGRDGADPAGLLRVTSPGLMVLGYQSRPTTVTLPAEKFNLYLKEEGLDEILALRAARKQSDREGQEAFARCARSLLLAGAASATQHDQSLGFTLELVAERNPYLLAAGDELPLRLTYQSRPVAGALVVAINRRNPSAKISARSDADGRVRLRLTDPGMWLIKSVHMVPAPAGMKADWMSYWASLTFEMGEAR